MTTTRTAPAPHIAASTHTGRWARPANGVRSDVFTARELVEIFGVGQVRIVWEFSGHTHGEALYCRTRFIGQEDGSLAAYAKDGHLVLVHPADRRIRIITR